MKLLKFTWKDEDNSPNSQLLFFEFNHYGFLELYTVYADND